MLKLDVLRTYNLIKGNNLKKIIGCYRSPGVRAVIVFRFGQWLKNQNIIYRVILSPLYFYLFNRIRTRWGIDIPRSARIGAGLYIGHFGGIIISGQSVIGENVNISQNVTIGVAGKGDKRGCPVIGNNVQIAPGAVIYGKITIGNNVKIGPNTVVYKDVPGDSVVLLSPGYKIVSNDVAKN